MPQKLLVKIFLGFWLAMALVWSAFVLLAELGQNGEMLVRLRALTDQRLVLSGRVAVSIHRRGGDEALNTFMAELEEQGAPYPFVFTSELDEISSRDVPEEAHETAAATLEEESVWRNFGSQGVYAGRVFTDRSERTYAVVQRFPSRQDFPPASPWLGSLRWVAVLLTSGLVCFALARYLVGPVATLSTATRRFASGDLSARVGADLARRNDEVSELGRDFDEMAERIGALLNTQRQLLSDISHELRSPLARMYVALELARRKAGPEAEESLRRIERESERLNELIGELLALTRLEDPATLDMSSSVELRQVLRRVVEDADYEARQSRRRVTLDAAEACSTQGVEELLHRAIENVVRNAVRYTPDNTRVETSLTVQQSNGTREARIVVRDHGPGVPESDLTQMFKPFFRSEHARDRESGGTGLGLSISERAVRAHGGAISARNAEDGGLMVEIRLPAGS